MLFTVLLLALMRVVTPCSTPSSSPLPPSQDPWYKAPPAFEDASTGEILRIRPAPGNLTTTFSNSSAAFNILYRTTNSHYEAFWAVTTLFVPAQTDDTALLSYQIPYNSADVDGSPSYILYAPASAFSAQTTADIQTALGKGWYVNVPDFNGPLTSFGAGVQMGLATLDSVRAARNADTALHEDAVIALWGYSGGSIGSEWAAELQPAYAPELEIAGAALGGLVANESSVIAAAVGTQYAGLVPEATLGLISQYPEAMDYLRLQLKDEGPYNETGFLAAQHLNIEQAFAVYFNQNIYEYFESGSSFFEAPVIQDILKQETYMGFHGIPQTPLFVYQAVQDELAFIKYTERLIEDYCSVGVDVVFERNTIGGHLEEQANGNQRALEWLDQVLTGTYRSEGCVTRDVSLNVTASAA